MRLVAPALLLSLACLDLHAAEIQLDPQTGLWFPPYASRSAYLNRDPEHPLMRDVERAFAENPALARDVCAAFLAAPEPQGAASNDPSVRQFRAMFAMTCSSRQGQARRQSEDTARRTAVSNDLGAMLDEEERGTAAIPEAKRLAMSYETVNAIEDGSGPALRAALRAIALAPNNTFAIHALLALPPERLNDGQKGASPSHAAAFLESLYADRAAGGGWQWTAGLPAVYLFEGKLDAAQKAAADWYAAAPRDRASYARVMAAIIDRARGNEGALDKLAAGCVPSAEWKASYPDRDAAEYCTGAAVMLTVNALDVRKERAPRGLADAAFEVERMAGDDWPGRLALIEKAGAADFARARKRFYEMLAEPGIPFGAQHDAVYDLAKLAAAHDRTRVAPLIDCWLSMHLHGAQVPGATPETWKQLASMPPSHSQLADCSTDAMNSWCVMHALKMRLDAAVALKQWNLAKQALERMAAIATATGSDPIPMRNTLADFAITEIQNDRRADAVAILSYLKSQPEDSYGASMLDQWASAVPAGAKQPWLSPVAVDAALVSGACPPRGE